MKEKLIMLIILVLLTICVVLRMVQHQKQIKDLNEKLDNALIKITRLQEENEHLWNNYYMNVTNSDGLEYYE